MNKVNLFCLLLLALMLSSCVVTERERRGVSHIPFNAPPETDGRRTFHGDF